MRDIRPTGLDASCHQAIYADKPMQALGPIARVNSVFLDKPGGLAVDYLSLADQLKKAIITYTVSVKRGTSCPDE